MTTNLVLVISPILKNIMLFLLRQNITNCSCFIIDKLVYKSSSSNRRNKNKKNRMYKNNASLYNTLLAIYFSYHNSITNEEKEGMDKKYDPNNLFLKNYKYDEWYKKDEENCKLKPEETIVQSVNLRRQKPDDEDLSDMPQR